MSAKDENVEEARAGRQRRPAREELRFRCCVLRYLTTECGGGLTAEEFAWEMKNSVGTTRYIDGCRSSEGAQGWIARGLGEPKGGRFEEKSFKEYEVLVVFAKQIRVARESERFSLTRKGWECEVGELPQRRSRARTFVVGKLKQWQCNAATAGLCGLFSNGGLKLAVREEDSMILSAYREVDLRGPREHAEDGCDETEESEEDDRFDETLYRVQYLRRLVVEEDIQDELCAERAEAMVC
jgi:hypothetical protein